MESKTVSASAIVDQVIEVFPNDLNPHGTLFGGRALQIADALAAIVSKRHSGVVCVTLGIDSVRFISPASRGDILVCKSSVNRTWRTSLEIGVKILAEDFTFVAIDENHKPVPVISVVPETPDQIRRYEEAETRRQRRLRA
jgi:acyl-CoA hydrolase